MNARIVAEKQLGSAADMIIVERAELAACQRRIHDGPLQEVATLRVALSVWARAAEAGDTETARSMVVELHAATERLVGELHAIELTLQRLPDRHEPGWRS